MKTANNLSTHIHGFGELETEAICSIVPNGVTTFSMNHTKTATGTIPKPTPNTKAIRSDYIISCLST